MRLFGRYTLPLERALAGESRNQCSLWYGLPWNLDLDATRPLGYLLHLQKPRHLLLLSKGRIEVTVEL